MDISKELLCIESIAKEYESEFSSVKSNGGRIKKGFLKKLIDEKKKEFSVQQNISRCIIHTHIYKGELSSKHCGSKSPLEESEQPQGKYALRWAHFNNPRIAPKHFS